MKIKASVFCIAFSALTNQIRTNHQISPEWKVMDRMRLKVRTWGGLIGFWNAVETFGDQRNLRAPRSDICQRTNIRWRNRGRYGPICRRNESEILLVGAEISETGTTRDERREAPLFLSVCPFFIISKCFIQ